MTVTYTHVHSIVNAQTGLTVNTEDPGRTVNVYFGVRDDAKQQYRVAIDESGFVYSISGAYYDGVLAPLFALLG
jgi:hypothetical protein